MLPPRTYLLASVEQMIALFWIDDVEIYRRWKRTCMEDGMARKVSIFFLDNYSSESW